MLRLFSRILPFALLPLALHAQSPAQDSLKGHIWTVTAQRIWADTKPRAPQPPAWPTNAAFTSWLGAQGKGEKSGIGLLRGDVVRTLGAGRPATAAQVAQAIVAEASNPPQSRAWLRQLDVPALQAALQQLTPLGAPAAATPGSNPVLATNDSSLTAPLPAAPGEMTETKVGFFGRNPIVAGLLGALLGAALTYGLLRSVRRRSRHRHHHASPVAAASSDAQSSAEVLRLQNEVQRLVAYIKQLEAKVLHYENANAADEALTDEPVDEPTLAPPVPPAQLPHQPVPPLAAEPADSAPARPEDPAAV